MTDYPFEGVPPSGEVVNEMLQRWRDVFSKRSQEDRAAAMTVLGQLFEEEGVMLSVFHQTLARKMKDEGR